MTSFEQWTPVLPQRRRQAARAQLEEVVRQSARPGRKRGRRANWLMSGAIVFCVTVVACTAAVVAFERVTNKTQARCYSVDQPSRRYIGIGMANSTPTPGQVRNARAVCASLFRGGFLTAGVEGIDPHPAGGQHPVPPLVVCVLPDGAAAVFPGGPRTCARLSLPSATKS
jgi:hypothetical protein